VENENDIKQNTKPKTLFGKRITEKYLKFSNFLFMVLPTSEEKALSTYDLTKIYIKKVLKKDIKMIDKTTFYYIYNSISFIARKLVDEGKIKTKRGLRSQGQLPRNVYYIEKSVKPKIIQKPKIKPAIKEEINKELKEEINKELRPKKKTIIDDGEWGI